MMRRSSLRFRIFALFAVLALALVGGLQVALWLGAARVAERGADVGFAFSGIVGTGLILLLCLAAWLYCDEHFARPMERLAERGAAPQPPVLSPVSSPLRPLAHAAPEEKGTALHEMRRLGQTIAALESEKSRLTQVLGELPVAVLVINAGDQIVLYDSQAGALLARSAVPRLNACLSDYFPAGTVAAARRRMQRSGLEVHFTAIAGDNATRIDARMRALDGGGALLVLEPATPQDMTVLPGPLIYDFDLLTAESVRTVGEKPLTALTFVLVSTETTGLLPHRDRIVRIGAARMVGPSILRHEALDLRIDPDPGHDSGHRPSERRPDILAASARLHDFATDAVIVAHNAPLRMAFLRRHDAATGLVWDQPHIDLVLLSALLFGDGADHSLRAIAGRTGSPQGAAQSRGGMAQALLIAEIMQRLLPMLTGRGLTTLGALMDALDHHASNLEKLH